MSHGLATGAAFRAGASAASAGTEAQASASQAEAATADTNGDLHGRKAGYPNWPSNNPEAMKTALYFDPVNFASRIKAPVMAGLGFIDTTSPPAGVWTALNQMSGPVEALPLIESEHDNLTPDKVQPCSARRDAVLDSLVHGGAFTPKVPAPGLASVR